MRLFERIGKKYAGCQLHGCDAGVKNCARCGWNKKEAARRNRLPLVRCADGLKRKNIGGVCI